MFLLLYVQRWYEPDLLFRGCLLVIVAVSVSVYIFKLLKKIPLARSIFSTFTLDFFLPFVFWFFQSRYSESLHGCSWFEESLLVVFYVFTQIPKVWSLVERFVPYIYTVCWAVLLCGLVCEILAKSGILLSLFSCSVWVESWLWESYSSNYEDD